MECNFLGPNLPAEEILSAVKTSNVNALLLSLIYPNDEPRTGSQIRKLRKNLNNNFPIIFVDKLQMLIQNLLQKQTHI